MASTVAGDPTDGAERPELMYCVYAISGTYGLLPRLLYYATLVFALFGRRTEWLIIGALVSALTYSGTAAIHAMALVTSKRTIYDLDIIGTYSVLSCGALAYIVMIHWSKTLQQTRARSLLWAWGVLVGTALIFSRVEIFTTELSPPEPACYSSTDQLLESPVQLDPTFDCTYKCFSASKPMRSLSEVIAVPFSVLQNRYTSLQVVLVGPIQAAAYAALTLDTLHSTPAQWCLQIVMKYIDPKHHEEITKAIYNTGANSRFYGGYLAYFGYIRKSRWNARKCSMAFFSFPIFVLIAVLDIFAIPMMIANIIINEYSIAKMGLPENESPSNIGQWGPAVGAALVVFAAVFNRVREMREEAQEQAAERRKALEDMGESLSVAPTLVSHDTELDEFKDQEIGVERPRLAHVPTLKDVSKADGPSNR